LGKPPAWTGLSHPILETDVKTVTVCDASIEYTEHGSGPPLIFLHGGDGPDRGAAIIEILARSFRVIYPSHPGFGGSTRPAGVTSADDLSYLYIGFIRALGLTDVRLAGVSFGGWIAAEIAVKSPAAVTGLFLVSPLGVKFAGPTEVEIFDLFSIPAYEQAEYLYETPALRSPDYAAMPEAQVMALAQARESFGLYGWRPVLNNPKLKQRLGLISCPTLLIWGATDRVVASAARTAWADAVPGADMQLIAGAGHYVHADAPAAVAGAILDFAGKGQSMKKAG